MQSLSGRVHESVVVTQQDIHSRPSLAPDVGVMVQFALNSQLQLVSLRAELWLE